MKEQKLRSQPAVTMPLSDAEFKALEGFGAHTDIKLFIARRAIVFATYTGVPDKKCVNLCPSVRLWVWCLSDVTLQDCRFFARL